MPGQLPYFCYVLWSENGRCFYTGVTDDLQRRLHDHNSGLSKWTKRYAGSWQRRSSPARSELPLGTRM